MATPREFLSFGLHEGIYAIPLTQVREIIGLPTITRLPNTPSFLRGVISLRGAIVPVVDLREQLELPVAPYTKFTVAIIVEAVGAMIGLIVDSALDVVSLSEAHRDVLPKNFAPYVRADFLVGLAHTGNQTLVLLDVERVLTDEQRGVLRERLVG
jgi:purine-binding chemotaxis protein CheW